MPTRRDVLRLLPAAGLAMTARADDQAGFVRIDTHVHIHRDAPALIAEMREAGWRGLDIVVSPAIGEEKSDLDEKMKGTLGASRESGGVLAWASTFDARGFEEPDFTERTIARIKQSFDDGAVGVKIWKNIGMAIRGKDGPYLLADNPALLPIYAAIEKADRTLIAHLAEPDGAWLPLDEKNPEIRYYSANPKWHMHGKPGVPSKDQILAARDRVLARFPKLRVVGAHLGSDEDDLNRLARRLDQYPNFSVDMAARIRYFARGDREAVLAFLAKYQDRLLYATDFALRDLEPAVGARSWKRVHDLDWAFFSTGGPLTYDEKPTRGLDLPEPILRKLFRENALRMFPQMAGGSVRSFSGR